MPDMQDRIAVATKVCHLYYEDGLGQQAIAAKLRISRPTVSRLLRFAREQGIVRIQIVDPTDELDTLARRLEDKYHLKKVLLSYDASGEPLVICDKISRLAADYLDEIVKDGDSIGICWGRTLKAVADHLHASQRSGVGVVQLKGSVPVSDTNNYAGDITKEFGLAFHANPITLPLPVIFDNAVTHDTVLKDRFISGVMRAGVETNIAIFTTGTVRDDAMLFRLGYLKRSEIARLQGNSVGDIISRFITADGEIADRDIDARTVGIPLDRLRDKRYSILVAGSVAKVPSMHGALTGGYANVLITDSSAARQLLAL